jgi:putative addiction module component (TIGR02574 family)
LNDTTFFDQSRQQKNQKPRLSPSSETFSIDRRFRAELLWLSESDLVFAQLAAESYNRRMSIAETIAELSALPPAERLRVAEAIWDSLDDSAIPDPTEKRLRELERRLAAHDADPSTALTPQQIEERVSRLRLQK